MSSPPYVPIEVVDLDSDNDGVLGSVDFFAFSAAHPSVQGDSEYDRQFDADFDDDIDDDDQSIFADTFNTNNDLETIRNAVKTTTVQKLTWSDGWEAWLVALDQNHIKDFIGKDNYSPPGWISVHRHPYIGYPTYYYVCLDFAVETAVASYKALGYGCLLYAAGVAHAYNVFWIGGDWTDLNNWRILESQNGAVYSAVGQSGIYETGLIYFFDYTDDEAFIYAHFLNVDVAQEKVSLGTKLSVWGEHNEEPIPATFDRTLGVPSMPTTKIGYDSGSGADNTLAQLRSPTVITYNPINILQYSALGRGTIVDTGNEYCDKRGVEWGTASGNYTRSAVGVGSFSTGFFAQTMGGLNPETIYYYRAKAHNAIGWSYGSEKSFQTAQYIPPITTKMSVDSGDGIEVANKTGANIFSADTGNGIEGILDRAILKAESGSGVESYKREIPGEFASLVVSHSRSDISLGLDALIELYSGAVAILGADSGSGAESYKRIMEGEVAELSAALTPSDDGSGTDALIALLGFIIGSDSGIGTATPDIRSLITVEDGSGLDALIEILRGFVEKTGTDSGIGTERYVKLQTRRGVVSFINLREIVSAVKRTIEDLDELRTSTPATKRTIQDSIKLRKVNQ